MANAKAIEETLGRERQRTRKLGITFAGIIIGFLAVEEALRVVLGLGNPPLYKIDFKAGYVAVPDQHLRRFGHRINYDNLGLRDVRNIIAPAPPGTDRILCVGDSVMNGGVQISDDQSIPSLIEFKLRAKSKSPVEVYNAAIGGWAPSNEYGFLMEVAPSVRPKITVFEINEFDLFQPLAGPETVNTRSFPSEKPRLAIVELLSRYIFPRLHRAPQESDPGQTLDADETASHAANNLITIRRLIDTARSYGSIPVVWYMDGAPPSIAAGKPGHRVKDFLLSKAEADLFLLSKSERVPLIYCSDDPALKADCYRDGVHPNEKGNEIFASHLASRLELINAERK